MTTDFRFGIILFALIAVIGIVDRAMAEVDIAEERQRITELRQMIDRAEDTAEQAREMLPPPLPELPPPPDWPSPPSHPDLEAMEDRARLAAPRGNDCPMNDCDPQTEPEPITDPCPNGTNEERARCWVDHAFPPAERAVALRVAKLESGHTFDPTICYGFKYYPNPVCAGRASGLFQHRPVYWPEREQAARLRIAELLTAADVPAVEAELLAAGLPDRLNIWDGWHNALVSALLAGRDGWRHWDVCLESAPSDYPNKFRCGAGKWL